MIDQAAASELRPLLYGTSGRIRWGLMFLVVLVGLCSAAAHFGGSLAGFVETPPAGFADSAAGLSPEDRTSMIEIRWAQQKASEDIAELSRLIDAQRRDLKGISDHITVLTSRIDSLQIPAPVPSNPSVISSSPAQAASSRARKRVERSKPQGSVSVGGAPVIAGQKTGRP
ncbi:putative coiled-coil protein SlyX [Bradyrhizobium sp. USDA 4461]